MPFYWLTLGALAVWRLTYLLNSEDGPFNFMARARALIGEGPVGQVLDCFYCASLWVALPFANGLGKTWSERFLLWLALSGAASLFHRATLPLEPPTMPTFFEDEEPTHVLRSEPNQDVADNRVTLPG
jgi:hypothetical protein